MTDVLCPPLVSARRALPHQVARCRPFTQAPTKMKCPCAWVEPVLITTTPRMHPYPPHSPPPTPSFTHHHHQQPPHSPPPTLALTTIVFLSFDFNMRPGPSAFPRPDCPVSHRVLFRVWRLRNGLLLLFLVLVLFTRHCYHSLLTRIAKWEPTQVTTPKSFAMSIIKCNFAASLDIAIAQKCIARCTNGTRVCLMP